MKILVTPGVNTFIFNHIKNNNLSAREKLCIIMFDEMSIEPTIAFNSQTGEFEGFEDFGDKQTDHIANHVQVFMIRSIVSAWKQPLSFAFSKGSTNQTDLVRLIKKYVSLCSEAGFTVVQYKRSRHK